MNEILPGLLVKSALLSVLALLTVGLLRKFAIRRVSAAARHLICLNAFAALLLLPVLSIMLPAWRVVPVELSPTPVPPPPPVAEATTTIAGEAAGGSAADDMPVVTPSRHTVAPPVPLPGGRATGAGSRGSLFPGLYAALSLVLLARLAFGHLGVWRMARRARMVPYLTVAGVPVRESAEVAVPLTAGVGRGAVIVLPAGFAASVSAERLDAVLAHEAAHVRRVDFLSQLLGDIVCALYFAAPFVWLLSGAMRSEAERAADDRVVTTHGVRPSDYAAHLLDTVRGLRGQSGITPFAVTMARCPDISVRIRAVLEANANRAAQISSSGIVGIGLACTVLAGAVASLRQARASGPLRAYSSGELTKNSSTPDRKSPFRHTLSDGTTVELAAVLNTYGLDGRRYWKPNGEPIPVPLLDKGVWDTNWRRQGPGEELQRYFIIAVEGKRTLSPVAFEPDAQDVLDYGEPRYKSLRWNAIGSDPDALGKLYEEKGRHLHLATTTYPAGTAKSGFQFGISTTKWLPVATAYNNPKTPVTRATASLNHPDLKNIRVTFQYLGVKSQDQSSADSATPPRLNPNTVERDKGVAFFVTSDVINIKNHNPVQARFVVVLATGEEETLPSARDFVDSQRVREGIRVRGVLPQEWRAIRMEVRPYEWVNFSGIRLNPNPER